MNLQKPGFGLCAAGVLLSFALFVLSLPGAGIGVWLQSELATAGLHFCAFLCGLGIAVLAAAGKQEIVVKIFSHAYVILPFLIGLISLVFMPWNELPVRSLLGAVQTGEGVAWWFDWALLSAAMLLLWRFKIWRRVFAGAAAVSLVAILSLCLLHRYSGWGFAPYYFPDFLALPILAMVPVFWAFVKPERKTVWLAGFFVVLNILLFLTHNNIGIAYGLVGAGFFLTLWLWVPLSSSSRNKLSLMALAAVPPLVVAGMFAILALSSHDGYYGLMRWGPVQTVASRAYLISVVMSSFADSPWSFFTGEGWGMFTEHMARHLPLDWVDLTIEGGEQWDGMTTEHFHAHNMFVESFISAGVFVLAVLYIYVLALPFFAARTQKIPAFILAGGLASIGSFWFLLPLCVPFMALGAAACSCSSAPIFRPGKIPVFVFVALALAVVGAAGLLTFETARINNQYIPDTLVAGDAADGCRMDYQDFGAGGMHLARMLMMRPRILIYDLEEKPEEVTPEGIEEEILRINHLLCKSEIYISRHKSGLRLRAAQLIARGETLVALGRYMDPATRDFYHRDWRAELLRWLQDVPVRSDMAVTYMLWHFAQGQEGAVREMAGAIRAHNPDDPVGLWFEGLVLTGDPARAAAGLDMMRRALKGGIERFMPVEKDLKDKLLSH